MSARWQSKPGSSLWLFRHEWRMFFFDMGDDKSGTKPKRGMPLSGKLLSLLVLAVVHAMAWMVLRGLPALHDQPDPMLVMAAGMALAVLFSMMLSMALNRSVKALFERGDLDLLLSSPMPAQSIFTVRLASIVLGVAFLFLLFLSPFAHVGLLIGQWRWLGIYPAILALAVLASCLAMVLTLSLVKWLGARRTKTVAHMLGALSGAVIFLGFQLFNQFPEESKQRVIAYCKPWIQEGGLFDQHSLVWLPARALFGAWQPALIISAVALVLFWLTSRYTCRFFIHGVQQSVSAPTRARPVSELSARLHFRQGLYRNVMYKEWRLLLRDPQLLSQIALQLLYLLPAVFLLLKNGILLPGMAATMTFLTCSLTGSLIWVIVAAEDAPDLLRSAPVTARHVQTAKLLAACLPVALLVLPLIVWLSMRQWQAGLITLLGCSAGMLSVACIHLWLSKPGNRNQFNRRGQGQISAGIIEAVCSFSWGGMVLGFLAAGSWGWIGVLTGVLSLVVAWLLKIERS